MAAGGGGNYEAFGRVQEEIFPSIIDSLVQPRKKLKRVNVIDLKPGTYFEQHHKSLRGPLYAGIVEDVKPIKNYYGEVYAAEVKYKQNDTNQDMRLYVYIPYYDVAFYMDMIYEQVAYAGLRGTAQGPNIRKNSHIVSNIGKRIFNMARNTKGGRRRKNRKTKRRLFSSSGRVREK